MLAEYLFPDSYESKRSFLKFLLLNNKFMLPMLLTQSVFLGVFLGTFDISAHALFLSVFDEKMMARGYIVSGIAGIILTSLYDRLSLRMEFKNVAIINLILVTSLTFILWIALVLSPGKWVIFFIFIMLGPLNILAILGFRETAGRLFSILKGKRSSGIADEGLITGIIIGCLSIPVLLFFKYESHNILLITASSVLAATVIQIIIGVNFQTVTLNEEKQLKNPLKEASVVSIFRKDPYVRIMAIFLILSVITAFFVQYSFMAVTRIKYPLEKDMALFLGKFTAGVMICALLAQVFGFSYLLRKFNLGTLLGIFPLSLAIFTAIAILTWIETTNSPGSASGYLIFFLILALGRLISKSLKVSTGSSSFKIIYKPIDEEIRYKVKSVLDGTVNEIAALLSGLVLTGLGIFSFIKLIHFSWILFIIILIWLFVAFRLYSEYRKSLAQQLEAADRSGTVRRKIPQPSFLKSRYYAERAFRANYFSLITGDYSSLENNISRWYYKKIIDYSGSESDINLLPVLKKIAGKNDLDDGIRSQAEELINFLKEISATPEQENFKIISSNKLLSDDRMPQTAEILRLLRDTSLESKRLAIYIIGKFKLSDMLPEVGECLSISGLESDAYSVLRTFGGDAVEELESLYLVSSGNTFKCKTILRLFGELCTKESTGFLFARLWSHSGQIKETALKCLIGCRFVPSRDDKNRLNHLISDVVDIIIWDLSAKVCLEKHNDTFP